ncbi:MAG TPA: acyl-CoA dehydrogenase family protein [Verrucomicrobiae bacterium]|nr:acyl-CoA dehydrogenase family protein [Verrucomicrobiae bacterium]
MSDAQSLLAANSKLSQEVLLPAADQIDQTRRFPRENLTALGKAGVLGLMVPAQYGGAGAGLAEMSRVIETQAQACASTAMVTLMHFCATSVISAKGGDALKRKVLPAIARGEHIGTLAFSEAGSGGHFYAPISQIRQEGAQKRLSASKSFVTSAGEADSYVVSARRAGAAGPTETSLYVVPNSASGFVAQGRFEGLGLAGNASAPMVLADVTLDDDARLGPDGSGFQSMLEVVLPHFQVGVASVSLGIASAAFQTIAARVGARKYEHAGGAALASIPRVQFLVAEMALELNAARAYLAETVRKALAGDPAAMLDVLGVKAKAAEAGLNVVSRAMTLGGGWAFGRRGGLERNFRDAQAAAVMAPATDILKDFMGKACLGLPLF